MKTKQNKSPGKIAAAVQIQQLEIERDNAFKLANVWKKTAEKIATDLLALRTEIAEQFDTHRINFVEELIGNNQGDLSSLFKSHDATKGPFDLRETLDTLKEQINKKDGPNDSPDELPPLQNI
jgi:hypothetical protein